MTLVQTYNNLSYTIESFQSVYIKDIKNLYKEDVGFEFSLRNQLLLYLIGKKNCFIVLNKSYEKELLGFAYFYFNKKDIHDCTIHLAHISVCSSHRGMGISKNLLNYAIVFFSGYSSIKGISSRISINNIPSIKLHLSLGFEIVEKYFDETMNEERVYVIRKFDRKNDK